jgi:acyl-CoA thioester hydrolase
VQLRWSDPDSYGHVNHARALGLLEDARLPVQSWLTRIGTKSLTMRQELLQDDDVAIRLDAVLVVFDVATDTSRPLTDEERAFWGRYLAGARPPKG